MTLPNLETLSLQQQVAQMVVVRASGYLFDHQIRYRHWEPLAKTLQELITHWGIGGAILLGGSAAEMSLRCQQLQNWANIPLLIAADIEEGVGQRFSGATWFPPPMALNAIFRRDPESALQYADKMGAITAKEASAIGINWILAPVVDVNNNPYNPVINVRAFGESPEVVKTLASAFIRGAKDCPVLTTAKHFPGHGDTSVDSHFDLPILPHSWERLAEVELPPFVSAIASGVDAVMSAHLLIPTWDAEKPATLSKLILTEQLRKNLNFSGLIVTDALVMGAIANRYGTREAAVLAVEAGADILLMPLDPIEAIQSVCEAVANGRISLARIQESVRRIWLAKQKVLSSRETKYSLFEIAHPAARETATDILNSSQVSGNGVCRKTNFSDCRNLILVDCAHDCQFLGKHTPAIAFPEQLGYQLQVADRYTPRMVLETDKPTLLQIFVRGLPWRGSAGLTEQVNDWFQALVKAGNLQALVIYGSPYILEQFLPELPSTVPYVFTYGQMSVAQAIALATLFPDKDLLPLQ